MLTALRHPASADQSAYGGSVPEQRRLLGPGQPLTDSAFETVNSNVLGVVYVEPPTIGRFGESRNCRVVYHA